MSDQRDSVKDSPEWRIENLKGAIKLAAQTLKSLEIVNGGAAIAVLTFYGHQNNAVIKQGLVWALSCFGVGVVAATIAAIFAYLSQRSVATGADGEICFFRAAFWSAVGSAVLFLTGLIIAGRSFIV